MLVKFIGSGAAGNKAIVSLVENQVADKHNCLLLNTTVRDVDPSYRDIFIKVGDSFNGSGKERNLAKRILANDLKKNSAEIEAFCKEGKPDMIVLVSSTSGGSGSGITTLLAKYIKDVLGVNVHVFGFTGFETDGRELENTIEFFQDIEKTFGIESISNKKFLVDKDLGKAEIAANLEFCERMRILQGLKIKDSNQNIDDTDLYKLTTTPGFMYVEHIVLPKIKNAQIFDGALIAAMDETKSLETSSGCRRLGVILNYKNKSDLQFIDTNISVLRERWGIPYESFLHIQHEPDQDDYIDIIIAGMKLPTDVLKETLENYKKVSFSVDTSDDEFYETVGNFRGESKDSMFNLNKKSTVTKKEDFFAALEDNELEY